MKTKLKMPKISDTANEMVVVEVLVSVGEQIRKDQVLFTVETDKSVVENQTGVWTNDNKREEWMDDFKGKIYVEKPGWHWVGIKENAKNGNANAPDMKVNLRALDRDSVDKYCADIQVLTKEQAKEMWSKPGSERVRNDKEIDSDIPF